MVGASSESSNNEHASIYSSSSSLCYDAYNGTGAGNGAKSLGVELGKSQAFASCQVRKVFKTVCLREPENAADRTAVSNITATFTGTGYDMKQVFADTAVHCMGQ